MINFNENQKLIVYHINKTSIDLDVDIDRNKQNITCLDRHLISNILGSIHEKLSNTAAELKKCVAIKKYVLVFYQDRLLSSFTIIPNIFRILNRLARISELLKPRLLIELKDVLLEFVHN